MSTHEYLVLESIDADHERQLAAHDGDGEVLVYRRCLRRRPEDKTISH